MSSALGRGGIQLGMGVRPFGVYPLVCDLQVPIHYGCGGLLFRWTRAARYIIKTCGDKQRRKHLIDPK